MNFVEKLKKFTGDAKRVLIVAKKPSKEEFLSALKITSLGIITIGIVGFITFLIFHFLVG